MKIERCIGMAVKTVVKDIGGEPWIVGIIQPTEYTNGTHTPFGEEFPVSVLNVMISERYKGIFDAWFEMLNEIGQAVTKDAAQKAGIDTNVHKLQILDLSPGKVN